MSKRQKLQRIRLELEQSLYAIIDETFNQLQELIKSDSESEGDNGSIINISSSSKQSYKTTSSSSNSSSSSDESESDTLNSSLANLPLCELQTTISTHKEPLTKPSTISPQKPLVQSKTDSEQFSSPVITKRMEYPVKRDSSDQSDNPPPLTKKKNSILSPNSAFRKSLQCVTPIKDKKMKKSYKPTQQQSGTPPHFWSLDMPPTP